MVEYSGISVLLKLAEKKTHKFDINFKCKIWYLLKQLGICKKLPGENPSVEVSFGVEVVSNYT